MLTEDQLRDLLGRAGSTVEVEVSSRPVVTAPRRGRGRRGLATLAVAASVAAVAGLGLWIGDDDGPPETDAETVLLDGVPEGGVPSVFAHTVESATALLEGSGLEVAYRQEISCDPEGRPIGTDPAVGTQVAPRSVVTLLLSYQGAATDCFPDLTEPWRFMDFATGRGPAPRFADEVVLVVDGQRTTTLSAGQAARGSWTEPSALTALRTAAAEVLRTGGAYQAPTLQSRWGTPPAAFCGVARPGFVGDREALTLTVDVPGAARACPARVSLYRSDAGIDTVVAWTAQSSNAPADRQPVPDVVGLSVAEARDEVAAAGFTTTVEELETCAPRPGVVEQAPTQQALEEDARDDPTWSGVVTLVVEVPHTRRDCDALEAAAVDFVRFARGGPPPAWSPEVQQLFGYALRDRVTPDQADDPATWSFCSGSASTDCPVSALAVVRGGEVETGEYRENYECELIDNGGLPAGLRSVDRVVLFPVQPSDCAADWSVELWIDRSGAIAAVNLLVSPAVVVAG